ncbi:MAG TPA: hypothetical protein VH985_03055 [Candidatus Binatia bacterium]|jgi:hypothetical protein
MYTTSAAPMVRRVPLGSFFEPDILTSHQFLKVYRQKGQFEPEERLMFAVLTDAIECFQKYFGASSRRCRALHADAEAWIASKESRWPYSFEHICQVLNISPSYLRLGLMKWRLARESDRTPRKRIREPLRYQYRVKHNRISM